MAVPAQNAGINPHSMKQLGKQLGNMETTFGNGSSSAMSPSLGFIS